MHFPLNIELQFWKTWSHGRLSKVEATKDHFNQMTEWQVEKQLIYYEKSNFFNKSNYKDNLSGEVVQHRSPSLLGTQTGRQQISEPAVSPLLPLL